MGLLREDRLVELRGSKSPWPAWGDDGRASQCARFDSCRRPRYLTSAPNPACHLQLSDTLYVSTKPLTTGCACFIIHAIYSIYVIYGR